MPTFVNIILAMIIHSDKIVRYQQTKTGKKLMRFIILFYAYFMVIYAFTYSTCIWITNFKCNIHFIKIAFIPALVIMGFSIWFTKMGLKNIEN